MNQMQHLYIMFEKMEEQNRMLEKRNERTDDSKKKQYEIPVDDCNSTYTK